MPVSAGAPAPEAAALAADGRTLPLRSLAARGPALLFFFKGSCPATAAAAGALPRLAAVRGVSVAAISQDDAADTAAFAAEHGWGSGVLVLRDPEPWPASDAYGVQSTPTWVLVAPDGRIERVLEGWSRDDANALAARAAEIAGAPPAVIASAADGGPAFRPG